MNIVVVGAGAVGSLLGWALAGAGHEVRLVGRRQRQDVGSHELVAVRPDGSRWPARVQFVTDPADAPTPELVVTAVKMYDLPAAVGSLERWPAATVLTVENGVGAEAIVAAARPGAGLIAGSLTASVELGAPGEVRWLSRGGIGLAAVEGNVTALSDELVAAFSARGLHARRYRDADSMKWSKLVANLVANATSAILDEDPGAIYSDPRLFRIEHRQLREALAVMRCLGLRSVALPGADVRALALATALPSPVARLVLRSVVVGARGGKSPSLRRHVATRGGPSEVRWLNGAVAEVAARCGTAAPVNAVLTRLVDEVALDPGRRAWFRGRRDRLLEAVGAAARDRAAS